MKSVASAPGKAILFGEHAVVYGIPAIAAALSDLRLFVTISETSDLNLKVSFEDILDQDGHPTIGEVSVKKISELVSNPCEDVKVAVKPDEETAQRLKSEFSHLPSSAGQGMIAITYLVGHILQPFLKGGLDIRVKSHGLPIGAGLGSSAAFSVASSAACLQLRDKLDFIQKGGNEENHSLPLLPENLHTINSWAFMAEVLIHGTPSGLDNTASTYGGMIKFRKLESSNEYETFTNIPKNLKILLTNTKVPRSTKQLVSSVRDLYNTHVSILQSIFHSIEEITNQFVHILQRNDKKELSDKEIIDRVSELISINHHLLGSIGVGHPALTTVVETSKEFLCAAKLTGAGGGGCAITLVREEAKVSDLVDRLRSFHFDVFESSIGGEGVRFH